MNEASSNRGATVDGKLSTDPYKGTRDFYPEDMAIQRYIFDTWAKTAELFGYERYDASVLEPSDLYKSKGAENEELVNEQTYTFTDRGDREVTLRPEMTPTVARMIAGKRRELSFPVRWYSIPNLFRYERPQRGRLREHWQLNCDMFGSNDISADIEMIALAHDVLTSFGATPDMFEIRINDREWLEKEELATYNLSKEQERQVMRLIDKKDKIKDFDKEFENIAGKPYENIHSEPSPDSKLAKIVGSLKSLGVNNVIISPSTIRGFDYYTGIIFEIFDTSPKNNRAILGGGRYDNLTGLFDSEPVSGIGFGMGDVTMRDFLETHGLLDGKMARTAATLSVIPMEASHNIEAEKIAQAFRTSGVRTSVDISEKKIGKKISAASEAGVTYILVVGADEIASQKFILKKLSDGTETSGHAAELVEHLKLAQLSKV